MEAVLPCEVYSVCVAPHCLVSEAEVFLCGPASILFRVLVPDFIEGVRHHLPHEPQRLGFVAQRDEDDQRHP